MKKYLSIILVLLMFVILTACSDKTEDANTPIKTEQQTPTEQAITEGQTGDTITSKSKFLVVYFTNTGNTKAVAENISEFTGGDLYEIVPVTPYPDDTGDLNDELHKIAQREKNEDARPAISGTVDNFAEYETIFIGYPIWWGSMPMITRTFLDSYDFSGKTVVPFCTNGGSGFADSQDVIKQMIPEAALLDGLQIRKNDAKNSQKAVKEWLTEIGVLTT